MERSPSILNDVMGPVMRGPSSSHTAASWRMARTAGQLLGEEPASALVEMDRRGTWASNYREQGTALGMDGGLLGLEMTDPRIVETDVLAREKGLEIEYRIGDFETDHTNTVRLSLEGRSGKTLTMVAVSTGGGMFEVRRVNGMACDIRGDSYHLLVAADPEHADPVHQALRELRKNEMSDPVSERVVPGGMQLTSPRPFPAVFRQAIQALKGVTAVFGADALLPVAFDPAAILPFRDIESLSAWARKHPLTLGELGILYEMGRSGRDRDHVVEMMKEVIGIVEEGITKGLKGTDYPDRILHRQSHLIGSASGRGKIRSGDLVNRMIAGITALMEAKSAMEVIVAIPTAGSCGTFGGTVNAFCDVNGIDTEKKINAYFAGGLIGIFLAQGPGFSAEEHGCQVETGAAGCMAAAALADLSGGDWQQSLSAASLALQNSIGLVCDPVADRVEVPCLGKNVAAGMNALAASSMALSGFDPVIPLDQVIETVRKVGRVLPSALCNTGKGGLAATKRAREIKARLSGKNP